MNDQLLSEAKQLAVRTRRTLTAVIEDAVREMLARQQQAAARGPVRLPTASGNGLQAGVDLDNSAALRDLMESSGGPDRR